MSDDLSAVGAEIRPLHEWAAFDPVADVVTIYDMRYSRQLLRSFAVSPTGFTFKIVARSDGVITISSERNQLEAAAEEMLAALIAATDLGDVNLEEYLGGRSDKCWKIYHQCKDAIAKATGAAQ